jgi:DNA-binding transcriptional MerR regulator
MRYTPAATAELSGFSLDTLRYYERIGLLFDIDRTPGGQRVFTDEDLEWLGVLRCLRDTGMPIAHMLRYAELCREGDGTLAERQAVLEQHAVEVEQRIAELLAQQEHLRGKIAWYRSQQAAVVKA